MIDKEAKLKAIAEILQGRVVDDTQRVEICVKGTILGFPATIEAFRAGFPFGVMYFIETEVIEDSERDPEAFYYTIMPRYAKGFLRFITRILLLESKGQRTGDKRFDGRYISSYNKADEAERFIRYPGVVDKIEQLYKITQFGEMGIRAQAGVYLSQQQSFNKIDLDKVRVTFKLLGELGQVLFEAF